MSGREVPAGRIEMATNLEEFGLVHPTWTGPTVYERVARKVAEVEAQEDIVARLQFELGQAERRLAELNDELRELAADPEYQPPVADYEILTPLEFD